MPVLGVGVDVLSAKRLADLVSRRGAERLAARILSVAEQPAWRTISRLGHEPQLRFLALRYLVYFRPVSSGGLADARLPPRRWTAKEAAYKALYPRHVASWSHLTVVKDGPKPSITYEPSASGAKAADGSDSLPPADRLRLHLSYSHDGGQTLAYVVAESDVVCVIILLRETRAYTN
jgi:holo-[acyl-carrier protein] synthase